MRERERVSNSHLEVGVQHDCTVNNGDCDLHKTCNGVGGSAVCSPCPVGFSGTTECVGMFL
jgi:hypothetical protein